MSRRRRPKHRYVTPDYRIAVRPTRQHPWPVDSQEQRDVDDVVVNDVSMFRLEQDDQNRWFACCYLRGESGDNRIAFSISYDEELEDVVVRVTEWPEGVIYEEGAGPPDDQEDGR